MHQVDGSCFQSRVLPSVLLSVTHECSRIPGGGGHRLRKYFSPLGAKGMSNLYLFWKRLQAVTGAARRWESRTLPALPKTINWGALHVTPSPAFKSSSSMKNPSQTQRAATPRAARGPAPVAVSAERGRGRGLGRSRLPCSRGCGGRAVFGRTGRLQAPPARPPEHKR